MVISHWKTNNKGVPEPVEGQKCRFGEEDETQYQLELGTYIG
ncbi:hypothetical protein [Dactylococcopsis salina]|nr:hypothetical protein [Dactylococcopsis salina]